MDCSRSSNRKPRRRDACSSGYRRRTCRGSRIPSRCRSASSRCMSRPCQALVAELAAVDTVPEPSSFVQPEAASSAELVPALAESVAKAKKALGGFDDAKMGAMWRLQNGGREILAMPRVAFVRVDHAEPLVSPSRPAARLPAAAQSIGAVGVRSDRRRESVRGVSR